MRGPLRAEKKAAELLEQAGVEQPPVPVETLAFGLGADITYEPYDGDVSAMLLRGDGAPVIGINSRHAKTRQRFSVAHEIGHLVMHKGRPMFVDRFVRVNWRNGESNQDEIEANAFAAELLMPRNLLGEEVERALTKRAALPPQVLARQLAKVFQVSTESMNYRLENLGILDPIALIG
jgi:Zn-dependent peptidase ImmA (M78 family)